MEALPRRSFFCSKEECQLDKKKIEQAVTMIIEAIGENPDREGLVETPARVARMYEEVFQGLEQSPEVHLSKSFEIIDDNMVLVKDIEFYSMCEHHFLPFYGKCHIAYVPDGRVAGLSKLCRTVDVFAKRPQLQERLTLQVAQAMDEYLGCKGVLVVMEATHMCMSMRGVQKHNAMTMTSCALGIMDQDQTLKDEAYRLMDL